MANCSSLYTGSIPVDAQYYDWERYKSATPTIFPWGPSSYYYPGPAPQRLRTRAHFNNAGSGFSGLSSRPRTASPRYTSDGYYATANTSQAFYTHVRASTPHGECDEDEIIDLDGYLYVLPPQSSRHRTKRQHSIQSTCYYGGAGRLYPTDYYYPTPSEFAYIERNAQDYGPRPARLATKSPTCRSSASVPRRPSNTRTSNSHNNKPFGARLATEADAKNHKIPPGYSLKNWDPTEKPILLLGSVFDPNSLGKWIYDWTVYHHGPATPISDMAGELWLLLIQLAGKVKRAEEVVDRIRSPGSKKLIDEYIGSGKRLNNKLRNLLKACESPMLKTTSKKGNTQLDENAGVEFVKTLFGRERELEKTEQLMQDLRLSNLGFDNNCEDILRNPVQ
ncbi:vegetative cell wall protein gp1 [Colletotrichum incanum]|uniref:Vegetative cell wall protein gp1 n=1 Tax=Colletotrichum incanum TaxID=1573173 RepID=A0A167ATT2_COLIC|nr:vegetative cell wall protein gp1 [Colletotrichum incanum]OHW89488.1 putative vegetative cell wall protein gp1 [Colletotrichum incanum]